MSTCLHVPYKEKFEPIVLPGEYVAIAESLDESRWRFYRVKYIEPFFIKKTTGTIVNGGSADVTVSELELHDGELGQIRIVELTTGFELEVRLPAATKKYSTKNTVTRIDDYIVANYPHLTEIFYLADNEPQLTVYNNSGADGAATIRFIGLRYILEPVPHKPDKYTIIYVNTITAPTAK